MPIAKRSLDARVMMLETAFALIPAAIFLAYREGWHGSAGLIVVILSAVAADTLVTRLARADNSLSVTPRASQSCALVIALIFFIAAPAGFPIILLAPGAAVCVLVGYHAYGGMGGNVINPAIGGLLGIALVGDMMMLPGSTPDSYLFAAVGTESDATIAGALLAMTSVWLLIRGIVRVGTLGAELVGVVVACCVIWGAGIELAADAELTSLTLGLPLLLLFVFPDPVTSPVRPLANIIYVLFGSFGATLALTLSANVTLIAGLVVMLNLAAPAIDRLIAVTRRIKNAPGSVATQ